MFRNNDHKIGLAPLKNQIFLFLLLSFTLMICNPSRGLADEVKSKIDSLLENRSIETLVKMRKALAKERDQLLSVQEKIRDRGVDVSQEFLELNKAENSNQDKILIRIAEYYIEEEDLAYERRFEEEFENAYDDYEKQLKLYQEGKLAVAPVAPVEPKRDYSRAIEIYDRIINNFPGSELVDEAYYTKAFLLDKMKERDTARQIFQKIIDEYPESAYAPEAYMNLAESFFAPKAEDSRAETIVKLNKAIQLYKNVLQYKDSPRYDEALYKLGWSFYRLAGDDPKYYSDAIVYFTAVVKDIERFKSVKVTKDLVRNDVEPEALEFIAASFIDPAYSNSGVSNVRSFIERLGMPNYGISVMENVGNRYAKIAQWSDARRAYNELLEMFPEYQFAPQIQKKIADAYIADKQFEQAYVEREKLFEQYSPQSAWYQQLEQSDDPERIRALNEAYSISEEAMRTNISYLYNIAKTAKESPDDSTNARNKFGDFVQLCQKYLDNYPTDENAYEINWSMAYVLDTELGRFEEAFSEYIRVSNDYLESERQLDAATNAITVADTLVKIGRAYEDPSEFSEEELANRQVKDLGKEEKMLAEAYDNYIKLFPGSAKTPEILAAAGALYYNHRKYDLARKYYKTMVTKFPESQQKSIGLVSLMNSYFFLGQYHDAEIVAKKILVTPDIPENQVEVAKSRVGESIFKNGERLAQEGNYLEAAKEYRRVYEEASEYVDFVDASLFRSARNFEKANEWQRAIDSYNILIENYPESKQVLSAFNNIAADFKELDDFLNVAKTNERISQRFPGTPEAENALFNASLFFGKAEAWQDAIRTNNTYIKTYPSNPESKDLLFENAKFYLKLSDLKNANRIYKEFATIYPNDPLTIEAYFNRGEYYFEHSKYDSAKIEFNNAIQRSEEFAKTGRDPNLFYAAEANYKLGQILYNEYLAIKLGSPQSNLRVQLEQKQKKLKEVESAFTKVVQSGSIRGFEAMYKIAEAYEEFANAIATQQLPQSLTNEQLLVQENQIFSASVPAYDRAVDEYKNVLINLPVLAEKLEISLDTTQAMPEPTVVETQEDTSVVVQKEVEVDSSQQVALKWLNRTRERISSIQYNVAERASGFIDEYLRVENPNQGIRGLIFQDQVLKTLVAPQVKITIDAHLKNIQVATELGLENKYVEESKRKVLLASNILADEYEKLTYKALDIYHVSLPTLESLVQQGETATTPDGLDYYAFQDDFLMQLIFNANNYAKTALNQYKTILEIAHQNNINNDTKVTIEQNMFNFGYESGLRMQNLAKEAESKSEFYLNKYDTTQNENFQLGSTFFDDQSFELNNYTQEVFSIAYNISKEMDVENIWTQLILVHLVEIDPATYLTDLPRQEFVVSSSAGWKANTDYQTGWNLADFVEQGWGSSVEVTVPFDMVFSKFDSLNISPVAMWVDHVAGRSASGVMGNPLEMQDRSQLDSLEQAVNLDSLQKTAGLENLSSEPDTVTAYFRKLVSLESKPIGGWIAITAERGYRLYLNDVYITGVDSSNYEHVEFIPFETFSDFVKTGDNVIAISATDVNGKPHYGVRYYMMIELVPGEIGNAMNDIRAKMRLEEVPVEKLRETGVLNKNRIID